VVAGVRRGDAEPALRPAVAGRRRVAVGDDGGHGGDDGGGHAHLAGRRFAQPRSAQRPLLPHSTQQVQSNTFIRLLVGLLVCWLVGWFVCLFVFFFVCDKRKSHTA